MSKGSKRSRSKRARSLTKEQKHEIKLLHETGKYSMPQVAEKLGITWRQVQYTIGKGKKKDLNPAAIILKALDLAEVDSNISQLASKMTGIAMKMTDNEESLPRLGTTLDRMISVRHALTSTVIIDPTGGAGAFDYEKVAALVELVPDDNKESFAAYLKELTTT